MEKIISEDALKKANNIEKCQILLSIIKGQARYSKR